MQLSVKGHYVIVWNHRGVRIDKIGRLATKQARSSRTNFAVDAIAKKNMEKVVVYRCQHANWRTQKSMTSDTRWRRCSRKPVFIGGITGFGEICTNMKCARARFCERRGNLPPVDDLEANYVRIELRSIEPRFHAFTAFRHVRGNGR